MNQIITIGREFGSGGRELGRRLAELLQIAYYDKEIIAEIAKRTSLSEQYVHHVMENRPYPLYPITIGRSFYVADSPVFQLHQSIYEEQSKLIRELADRSDCVIVGRCADYILEEYHPIRIFAYADLESRLARCMERASEEEKGMSREEMKRHMKNIDKGRAKYYEFYTEKKWGDRNCYDLMINTSGKDIKLLAEQLLPLFQKSE